MIEISIIITTYNSEIYLEDSINSIINQTFTNWHLIIVNDFSQDNTKEILNKFKYKLKNKLTIIENKENLGINISLNKALKIVKTPFFTRQDADDISVPNRLEILLSNLSKSNEYDFISSKMKSINNDKLIYPKKLLNFPQKKDFIKSLPFCNAPTLFKSKILNKIKFNTSGIYNKRFEDYEFFYQCYLHGYKGYNIENITYLVRQDHSYHSKITIKQRITEAFLKFKIYKDFKLRPITAFHILVPLLKIFFPLFFLKIIKTDN